MPKEKTMLTEVEKRPAGNGFDARIVTPLTEEQRQAIRAVAGRRKGDSSMDRLMEEVENFREIVRQQEIERQDAAERGRDK